MWHVQKMVNHGKLVNPKQLHLYMDNVLTMYINLYCTPHFWWYWGWLGMVWVFHGFSYMFTSLYEQCSKCFMQMPFDWGLNSSPNSNCSNKSVLEKSGKTKKSQGSNARPQAINDHNVLYRLLVVFLSVDWTKQVLPPAFVLKFTLYMYLSM
jgi:hypothetical protein